MTARRRFSLFPFEDFSSPLEADGRNIRMLLKIPWGRKCAKQKSSSKMPKNIKKYVLKVPEQNLKQNQDLVKTGVKQVSLLRPATPRCVGRPKPSDT